MMSGEFELRCPISPDLGYIRDLVCTHGRHYGLPDDRLQDLALAVNEAVTNVFDHGGRAGMVIVRGHERGITVEVLDVGGRLREEHLSTATPDPTADHGFGLWVIQRVCDEVTLEQTGLGSVLGLHFHGRRMRTAPFSVRTGRHAHSENRQSTRSA